MTRKKSSLQLFPSCHDFKSIRVPPDFPKKYKIQSSRISLITCRLCFETRYSYSVPELSFIQTDIGQISTWEVVINVKNKSIMKNLTV